jgi:hypothetical protein
MAKIEASLRVLYEGRHAKDTATAGAYPAGK